MGDVNPIRTLEDYSRPSHEGYRNTIELPEGNNVDFLKLVDSLDLDVANRERTRLRLFQFSLRYQASNWLERLPTGSISTWEDLTTRFLAQFFPPGRTAKLRNDILMFQQHQGESLSEVWTRFKDLLQKVPHHVLEDLAIYDNESWNDPRDFAKPVKAISLPQDAPSTSDRRLIKLKNQVQRLMEAQLAPKQPIQVNKITSSCEICSGPHDTQYCMKNPIKLLSIMHPRVPTNREVSNTLSNLSKTTLVTPAIHHGKFTQTLGLVSNFMASQDVRLSKFEADFKQQQSKMTNKINTVLKAITDRMAGALPSDTVKNPKLNVNSTSPVSPESINTIELEEEPKDIQQLEPKYPVATEEIGSSENDEEKENRCAFMKAKCRENEESGIIHSLLVELEDSILFITLAVFLEVMRDEFNPIISLQNVLTLGLLEETDNV
ncbi:MAK10-like protein [Tanacetum coccineum]